MWVGWQLIENFKHLSKDWNWVLIFLTLANFLKNCISWAVCESSQLEFKRLFSIEILSDSVVLDSKEKQDCLTQFNIKSKDLLEACETIDDSKSIKFVFEN